MTNIATRAFQVQCRWNTRQNVQFEWDNYIRATTRIIVCSLSQPFSFFRHSSVETIIRCIHMLSNRMNWIILNLIGRFSVVHVVNEMAWRKHTKKMFQWTSKQMSVWELKTHFKCRRKLFENSKYHQFLKFSILVFLRQMNSKCSIHRLWCIECSSLTLVLPKKNTHTNTEYSVIILWKRIHRNRTR